jgi:hypothetical protein
MDGRAGERMNKFWWWVIGIVLIFCLLPEIILVLAVVLIACLIVGWKGPRGRVNQQRGGA